MSCSNTWQQNRKQVCISDQNQEKDKIFYDYTVIFSVPDCYIDQDQTSETAGEEAVGVEDIQKGRQIKKLHMKIQRGSIKWLTSISAVCRWQTQAALQVVEGRQEALCVGGLQHPNDTTH